MAPLASAFRLCAVVTVILAGTSAAAQTVEMQGGFGAFMAPDQSAWVAIAESKDPNDFEAFVRDFPASPYARIARRKMKQLAGENPDARTANAKPAVAQNKATLGLQIKTLSEKVAKKEGISVTEGLIVMGVAEGQAGQKAGLRPGDVINSYNGEKVVQLSAIASLVRATEPGTQVLLGLWRDGTQITVPVIMGGTALSGTDAALEHEFIEALAAKQRGDEGAWTRLEKVARAGHADAQMAIGNRYYFGNGVPLSPETAITWYERAAASGNPAAHLQLGSMYWQGRGAAKDDARSRYHFQVAAEAGNRDAQYAYGLMLLAGEGGPADLSAARDWVERAAAQGLKRAKEKLVALDDCSLPTTPQC